MIPIAHLSGWAQHAPWPDLRQVEQDLIISRALCDLFGDPSLSSRLAFRGGTAINKLIFRKPLRYSEDIDLVQIEPGPIGPTVDAVRKALAWLGPCKREQAGHSMHLIFRFSPEAEPAAQLKLKVEINTREHDSLLGLKRYPFVVASPWFSGETDIVSYEPEELFGTKLRALLQRRKNRDLFDLHEGMLQGSLDAEQVIACFDYYLRLEGISISRAEAEKRMLQKLERSLIEDVVPLLPAGVEFTDRDATEAFERIWNSLITKIKGDSWKLTDQAVQEYRKGRFPNLLRDL